MFQQREDAGWGQEEPGVISGGDLCGWWGHTHVIIHFSCLLKVRLLPPLFSLVYLYQLSLVSSKSGQTQQKQGKAGERIYNSFRREEKPYQQHPSLRYRIKC